MCRDEIEHAWRGEWGRLLALLVAQYRRLDLAEDGLADGFESATRTWPRDGVPTSPAGWLLTAARRRVLDRLRAEAVAARTTPRLAVEAALQEEAQQVMADAGEPLRDERLRLVLGAIACSAAISACRRYGDAAVPTCGVSSASASSISAWTHSERS